MINPFKEINWKPGPAELRTLGWSFVIGFPCIAAVFFLIAMIATRSVPGLNFFLMLGGIGSALGVLCLLVPPLARPLYYVWYGLAGCIGIVVSNLLFILLFYIAFAPLGLFMRLIGRDPLSLKKKDGTTTYWKDAPPERPATRYFRQY